MKRIKRAKAILRRLNTRKRGCGEGKKGFNGRCVPSDPKSKASRVLASALGVSAIGIGLYTLLRKAKANPVEKGKSATETDLALLTQQESVIPEGIKPIKQDEQSLYIAINRQKADVVLRIKEKLEEKQSLDKDDWSSIYRACNFHCQAPTASVDIEELNAKRRGGTIKEENERYNKELQAWRDNRRKITENPKMAQKLHNAVPYPEGEFDYIVAKIDLDADLPDLFFTGNQLDLYDGFQALAAIAKHIQFSDFIPGTEEYPDVPWRTR